MYSFSYLELVCCSMSSSSPIASWEIDGETVETVSDFILGGSKITADGDCSHEIKRRLLFGRKVMTNLDGIFKSILLFPTMAEIVLGNLYLIYLHKIATIHWIIEKAREFQKNIYFCFVDYAKAFDYIDHNRLENSSRDGNTRVPYLPPEKSVYRSLSNS